MFFGTLVIQFRYLSLRLFSKSRETILGRNVGSTGKIWGLGTDFGTSETCFGPLLGTSSHPRGSKMTDFGTSDMVFIVFRYPSLRLFSKSRETILGVNSHPFGSKVMFWTFLGSFFGVIFGSNELSNR